MTLAEAKLLNLDVYMFHRESKGLQTTVANTVRMAGREAHEFTDHIGETELLCVAVGKRKNHGQTAKTVREFIHKEEN